MGGMGVMREQLLDQLVEAEFEIGAEEGCEFFEQEFRFLNWVEESQEGRDRGRGRGRGRFTDFVQFRQEAVALSEEKGAQLALLFADSQFAGALVSRVGRAGVGIGLKVGG